MLRVATFSLIARACVLFAMCLLLNTASADVADEKNDLSRIDQIQTLSDSNNAEALKQLLIFKEHLSADAAYTVRSELFKLLFSLHYDAGDKKSVKSGVDEFLELAESQHNQDDIANANIFKSFALMDEGKPELSLVQLKQVQALYGASRDPELQMRLHRAFASAYRNTAQFELALSHSLEALRWSDLQPRRKTEARLNRLDALASLYVSMKDPVKAMATVQEALALSPLAKKPKTFSSLLITQGVAYTLMKNNDEALLVYQKALKFGIDAGMPATEANALANLADIYLIKQDYKNAELYARQALDKSLAIADPANAAIAQVNVGFALAGQGKIKPGAEYFNAGIKYFEDSDSKADVEAVLGELATMYENAGMYKEALATLRRQQKLSNELFTTNRSKAVAGMQEQFNAEQRQKQIELLGKENALKDADIKNQHLQQIVTILGAVLTVMVGIFVFLMYRRVKKVNEQLQQVNTQLEFHAVRDQLTGLHNRRSFVELMKSRAALGNAERRAESVDNPDCLILLDIDLFKHINDTWGHAAGDSVLTDIAARLKKSVRDSDMVLRWGGEEFLIYSPKSNPAQITRLVDRVLRAIGDTPVKVGDLQIPVTVTAGFISLPFSGVPETACDWEKTLQIADMALYLGKAHGRNRAYGLARLLVPYEVAMPILERDLSAAISAKMVDMIEVLGPVQEKATHA
ncbi:tetratricopeptide repeat-containing diguanylate cyclase [Undibacterium parvum]|uniref:diguanylate cyclase n=1 Tax=Undibacterium parvum TaxID=401471 RepID=A0A3S9HH08_9BURK|nr:GGDEF domain-containing protein [Undibacterium parvum]AZP11373.1 GGDEF domain-containing protein [Undibacterium parvum]